jgi:hypothetical protein
MNQPVVTIACAVSYQFPPASALKGIEPDPKKDYKAWEFFQKWRRICGKTRMGIGCEKCQFFTVKWETLHQLP